MTIMSDVSWGKWIAERRKTLGLRQSDLAEGLAYSNQAISKIENDETQLPLSLLPSLCHLLKISLNDFLAKRQDAPEVELPLFVLDSSLVANNIASLRYNKHLSLTEEASYLGVSKGTLILYEKGESLPSMEGLLLLSQQSGKSPEEFLSQNLGVSPSKVTESPSKNHRLFWIIGAALLLIGIVLAIVLPLSLQKSANSSSSESLSETSSAASSEASSVSISSQESSSSTSITSSAVDPFPGLDYFWIKSGDGQDGSATLTSGTTTELDIMSEPLHYFVGKEATYAFHLTLVGAPTGVTLAAASDYLTYSLSLPASSKGTTFTLTSSVSLLSDASTIKAGMTFTVMVA
jgi:transcriptional regulator with XRE-family HTH domain